MKTLQRKMVLFALLMVCTVAFAQKRYQYTTVPNDPLKARIYTLDNGLKVYLTVNKVEPRIQTYIAVRVGGKNDPAETTGLAHYFEHLMFKGTSSFGTSNYAAEKPLLDEIERRFEAYRFMKDPAQRKAAYHVIDSISHEASKYAIANEYDKLMSAIGAKGTNAYTSYDVTCYTEDIPSNEVDNWAKIQSDRFMDNVIRGFHTELEAVYEEKNISLTNDSRKMIEAIQTSLFKNHPYGTQTVLGTQEQLKNPSITNIKKYYAEWYVPNNVAICMSGDLDFDKTVAIIDKYFGAWKPNPHLPVLNFKPEKPLTAPVVKTVLGPEAETILLGWRFPGKSSKEYDYLNIISKLLTNGSAGLFDLNLNQSQKVMYSYVFDYGMSDYSMLIAGGMPKQGQTLDEVKALMLGEIANLAKGNFDERLLKAIITNQKLDLMKRLEDNANRADMFVESFVNGVKWADQVGEIDRLSKITKKDVVAFAKRVLNDGYACVYKRQGVDPNEKKIEKPEISPIEMNRDKTSDFVKAIQNSHTEPIQPVFVDFSKDMSVDKFANGTELLYKKNTDNGIFRLTIEFQRGTKADKALGVATDYLSYLGTSKKSNKDIQRELYELACTVRLYTSDGKTYAEISGLAENQEKALALAEEWVADAQPDADVYKDFVANILKDRTDTKLNQRANFQALISWGMTGKLNSRTNILSEEELKNADLKSYLDKLKDLFNYEQTITYYGPSELKEVKGMLERLHPMVANPIKKSADNYYPLLPTPKNEVFLAPYKAKNIYMLMFSNDGKKFDVDALPYVSMFNEYFGGSMNGIVFQELRESRGLAYSAGAYYVRPWRKDIPFYLQATIISQNDKLMDCVNVFDDILDNMPVSAPAFNIAKEGLIKKMATNRTVRDGVIRLYQTNKELGLTEDINRALYEKVQTLTLDDVVKFQKENVKNRTYRYLILGDEKELDLEKLSKIAPVQRVTTEEIFGY